MGCLVRVAVLIRGVDFMMFGKSCLIIGGSVLIRGVDFRMFGKSCLIIGGSVLIRGWTLGCLVRVAL